MSNKIIFEGKSRKQLRFHEINAILLLLDYFDTDITCISPGAGKSPDLRIKNIEWELKSPHNNQALSRTKYYLRNNRHGIRRLIVITKNHKIIDFKDEL